MWISVGNQAYVFLYCVLGGMIISFVYDVFRVGRKTVKPSNLVLYMEDFIYWIIVSIVLFGVVYFSNEGEIRGYLLIGVILGIIIYALLLSKIVMNVFLFIIGIVYKIVVIIFNILLIPLRLLYKMFKRPLKFFWGIVKKGSRKVKRISKRRLEKIAMWKRIFKNVRKKI